MAVPTTGNFLMFGTGSNTTIAGAIIEGGANSETVASTLNFNALKALANINKFDAEFKEGATTLEQIVKSTQFRGYPIAGTTTTTTTIAPTSGNKELILNVYNSTTESIDWISVNYNFEDLPNTRLLNTVSGFSPPVYYYISGSEIPVGNSTYKTKMNVTASYTSSTLIYDVEPDSNSSAAIYTISASFFTDGTPRGGGGSTSPAQRSNSSVNAAFFFNPTTWTTMSLDITASYLSPPTTTTTTAAPTTTTTTTAPTTTTTTTASPSFCIKTIFFDVSVSPGPSGWNSPTDACNGTGTPLTVYHQTGSGGSCPTLEQVYNNGWALYLNSSLTSPLVGNDTWYKSVQAANSGFALQVDNVGFISQISSPCPTTTTTTTTTTASPTTTTTVSPTTTTTASPTTTTTTTEGPLYYTLNSCNPGDPLYDTTITPILTNQRYVDPISGNFWVWDNAAGTSSPQQTVNSSLQIVSGQSGCP